METREGLARHLLRIRIYIPPALHAVLKVPEDWLGPIESGQKIKFVDARGKVRSLEVIASNVRSWLA